MKYQYDRSYSPPAPHIELRLGLPGESLAVGPLHAFVDTRADASIIPFRYIEPLNTQLDSRRFVRSQWGERWSVEIYIVEVGIGEYSLSPIEAVADLRSDEIIVGRNIPNKLVVTLDGPKRVLEILE